MYNSVFYPRFFPKMPLYNTDGLGCIGNGGGQFREIFKVRVYLRQVYAYLSYG